MQFVCPVCGKVIPLKIKKTTVTLLDNGISLTAQGISLEHSCRPKPKAGKK